MIACIDIVFEEKKRVERQVSKASTNFKRAPRLILDASCATLQRVKSTIEWKLPLQHLRSMREL